MKEFFNAVSLSELVRWGFAGAALLWSYTYTIEGTLTGSADQIARLGLKWSLVICLLGGAGVYFVHRSLVFPFIEWALREHQARNMRGGNQRGWLFNGLFSNNTLILTRRFWLDDSEGAPMKSITKRLIGWSDAVHAHYTTAEAIALGSIVAVGGGFWNYPCSGLLVSCVAITFALGLATNYRLIRMQAHIWGSVD